MLNFLKARYLQPSEFFKSTLSKSVCLRYLGFPNNWPETFLLEYTQQGALPQAEVSKYALVIMPNLTLN